MMASDLVELLDRFAKDDQWPDPLRTVLRDAASEIIRLRRAVEREDR